MVKINKDQLFAFVTLLLSGYLCYVSFSYPSDASFFPRVLSIFLGIFGLFFLIRISLKVRDQNKNNGIKRLAFDSNDVEKIKSAGQVFGSIITYGLIVKLVNYEIATFLFMAVLISLLGFKRRFVTIFIAVSLTALLYIIFFKLLGVSRPESFLLQ